MDYTYDKLIGSRIREIRESQDLTQEQLSARLQVEGCDITRSALAKMEVGQRHIYAYEIKILVKVLKITYSDLFV